jgi:hypothetical protein
MTNPVIVDAPIRLWKCPSCGTTDRTQRADVHTQFHACLALGSVVIPLVEVQDLDDRPSARQVSVQSEYGYESAAIRTERLDGSNDLTVFPQPAVGSIT